MPKDKPRKRDPEAKKFARDQRVTANGFAREIWNMLRNRRCCGEKFRREYTFGPYTLDFCCVALQLVIEVDGEHHFTEHGIEYDRRRDDFLRKHGYQVLRIPGYAVLNEPREVRDQIIAKIKLLRKGDTPHPQPLSPKKGEGSDGN